MTFSPISWAIDLVARFFSNAFKDWRRDEELKEKGRDEQRMDDLDESERRRREADKIKRDTEGDGIVQDGEL